MGSTAIKIKLSRRIRFLSSPKANTGNVMFWGKQSKVFLVVSIVLTG